MSFFSFDSFQLLANSAETCNIRDQVLHIVAATGGNTEINKSKTQHVMQTG